MQEDLHSSMRQPLTVDGEVQQCAVCRRLFLLKSWATASKVVKEKMDDGSGTGAEQGRRRRREGRTARLLQSGEKFGTVPKLRGAQRRGERGAHRPPRESFIDPLDGGPLE